MKLMNALFVAILVVALAAPAFAKNDVTVKGDMLRDGYLTIDIDWQVDTNKYKGVPRGELRERVKDEMYKEMLPELVKKTEGLAVSFDRGNFTKLNENVRLVQTRKDGSEVFDVDMTVRFGAPCHVAQTGEPTVSKNNTREYEPVLLRSWDNTY